MEKAAILFLIADSVESGPYVSLVKVAIVVLMLLGWAAAAQWVDRDTDVVKTRREQWNLIVISGGLVATFVLLAVPQWRGGLFALGLVFWMILAGGAMLAYIVHRNSRVGPDARILTVGHAKRLLHGDGGRKKIKDKGQRVQIEDHEGNHVEFPDDPEEALAFQAVQDFLFDLLWRRASDVDVLAGKERYRLVYRIDGVASEREDGLALEDGERVFRYIKQLAGLNVEEIRRPQTGSIGVALLTEEAAPGPTDVFTSGTTAGERLRLQIHTGPKVFRLHELGFSPQRQELCKSILAKHHGLFLLASPRQHGLTTTQYAVLRGHDAYMNNIHALERRPLTELDNVTQQRYVGANTDVNYARMFQSILRREPDIIMVGECEDRETAVLATRAAVVDHKKIYMGMEAKDSFDALSQYLSLVGDKDMAAKALLGVLAQRLVRVLCTQCREAFEPDAATLKKLNIPAEKIEHFYRPPPDTKTDRKGKPVVCPKCRGTGYVGRSGIFELLTVDPAVAKLIEAGAPINRIKTQCRKAKMYYLQEEGLLKVMDGTTSMNEILRCLRTTDS